MAYTMAFASPQIAILYTETTAPLVFGPGSPAVCIRYHYQNSQVVLFTM